MPQLYVRRHYFYPPSRLSLYYEGVASQVRAETQVRPPLRRPAALHRVATLLACGRARLT